MKSSRREFLRYSALAGTGLLLRSFDVKALTSQAGNFLENIGVSTGISDNGILAAAGYSYIEESVRGFLVPAEDESQFEQKLLLLKDSKLPVEACNSFLPGNLKCVGPTLFHEEILKFSETAFKRARIAGVKTIVFGSGASRTIPQGFSRDKAKEQFISLAKKLAPIAQKYDVIISLEPLNPAECNFINSVAEGGEIVKVVNHGNFRLLADIYHMLMENESPESITRYGSLLFHTHIAEKAGRSAPGTNGDDFTPYFRALKKIKYCGRMSIECSWKNIGEQAPSALKSIRSLAESI
jgi:sugar phosphate isomerase/epimerase